MAEQLKSSRNPGDQTEPEFAPDQKWVDMVYATADMTPSELEAVVGVMTDEERPLYDAALAFVNDRPIASTEVTGPSREMTTGEYMRNAVQNAPPVIAETGLSMAGAYAGGGTPGSIPLAGAGAGAGSFTGNLVSNFVKGMPHETTSERVTRAAVAGSFLPLPPPLGSLVSASFELGIPEDPSAEHYQPKQKPMEDMVSEAKWATAVDLGLGGFTKALGGTARWGVNKYLLGKNERGPLMKELEHVNAGEFAMPIDQRNSMQMQRVQDAAMGSSSNRWALAERMESLSKLLWDKVDKSIAADLVRDLKPLHLTAEKAGEKWLAAVKVNMRTVADRINPLYDEVEKLAGLKPWVREETEMINVVDNWGQVLSIPRTNVIRGEEAGIMVDMTPIKEYVAREFKELELVTGSFTSAEAKGSITLSEAVAKIPDDIPFQTARALRASLFEMLRRNVAPTNMARVETKMISMYNEQLIDGAIRSGKPEATKILKEADGMWKEQYIDMFFNKVIAPAIKANKPGTIAAAVFSAGRGKNDMTVRAWRATLNLSEHSLADVRAGLTQKGNWRLPTNAAWDDLRAEAWTAARYANGGKEGSAVPEQSMQKWWFKHTEQQRRLLAMDSKHHADLDAMMTIYRDRAPADQASALKRSSSGAGIATRAVGGAAFNAAKGGSQAIESTARFSAIMLLPEYVYGKILTSPNATKVLLDKERSFMKGGAQRAKDNLLFITRMTNAGIAEANRKYNRPPPQSLTDEGKNQTFERREEE